VVRKTENEKRKKRGTIGEREREGEKKIRNNKRLVSKPS
jgi:hypothetical protein